MDLPQGVLNLFEHPDHVKFRVPPGSYIIHCKAYHLEAEDPDGMVELPDAEFFQHDEWERYEIVLVPAIASNEGEP